jgi:predicted enzyme related to lactoylglutathione lyase
VTHFEIPYDDGERAKDFYERAFGWQVVDMPEYEYTAVSTGPADANGMPSEVGFIGGGMSRRSDAVRHPVITLDVADIDAALAAVTDAGGSVVVPKQQVGDMGFVAYFADTEGNTMGMWQSA